MSFKSKKLGDVTFEGINRWYHHMFEKFGFLVLYKDRKENDRIKSFGNSLKKLLKSIKIMLSEIIDPDKQRDLKIIYNNVLLLLNQFNKNYTNVRKLKNESTKC